MNKVIATSTDNGYLIVTYPEGKDPTATGPQLISEGYSLSDVCKMLLEQMNTAIHATIGLKACKASELQIARELKANGFTAADISKALLFTYSERVKIATALYRSEFNCQDIARGLGSINSPATSIANDLKKFGFALEEIAKALKCAYEEKIMSIGDCPAYIAGGLLTISYDEQTITEIMSSLGYGQEEIANAIEIAKDNLYPLLT